MRPTSASPGSPLLHPDQLYYLGVDPDAATPWERDQVDALGIPWRSNDALASAPGVEAAAAIDWLAGRAFVLHLDLDVLDFTDLPLAENTDGRNRGPSLAATGELLSACCSVDGCRVLSIGELNPTRAAGTPDAIPRFIDALADSLS
jgi:arginase